MAKISKNVCGLNHLRSLCLLVIPHILGAFSDPKTSSQVARRIWCAGYWQRPLGKGAGPEWHDTSKLQGCITHDGSMVLLWCSMDPINIPPINVSIYTSTMDPSWVMNHLYFSKWWSRDQKLNEWGVPRLLFFEWLIPYVYCPLTNWDVHPGKKIKHRGGPTVKHGIHSTTDLACNYGCDKLKP